MEKIETKFGVELIIVLALIVISLIVNCIYFNDKMEIRFSLQIMLDANLLYVSIYCTYFVFIKLFNKQLIVERDIYKNKKLIIPVVFLIVLTNILNYLLFYTNVMVQFAVWLSNYRIQFDSFYRLLLLSPVLLIYFFQIKIKSFKWTITWKQLLIVLLMGFSLICIMLILGNRVVVLDKYTIMKKFLTAIRMFFYPALYEELLYRGMIIGVLLDYGVNESKANLIQAFIFAAMHWPNYRFFGIIACAKILSFIIPGLLFGKIYMKTKSITFNTLLHGLHNSIIMFFG